MSLGPPHISLTFYSLFNTLQLTGRPAYEAYSPYGDTSYHFSKLNCPDIPIELFAWLLVLGVSGGRSSVQPLGFTISLEEQTYIWSESWEKGGIGCRETFPQETVRKEVKNNPIAAPVLNTKQETERRTL